MAEQPEITEKQIAAFTNDQKPASATPHRRSLVSAKARAARRGEARRSPAAGNPGRRVIASIKRPRTDKLLENTLVNNIGTSEPLTKREAQILQSILAGNTNKQIARALSRSCRTVEYHRNRLMRKLNAHNAAELVKRAIAMGIT